MTALGRLGRGVFDFSGLHAFKRRLRPQAWAPLYLAHPAGEREFRPVIDSLVAFTRGRPLAFLSRAIRRAPAPLLHAFWALLVPWTVALALASPRWFPHPAIRWLWVGFDAGMVAGLRSLARRWRPRLASSLASAAAADSLLTALHAAALGPGRLAGPRDHAVAAVALAAPVLVAFVLRSSLAERASPITWSRPGSPRRSTAGGRPPCRRSSGGPAWLPPRAGRP
jgi:phosphatidylglycerol lysyltransferase